jgi:hypothetical protein
MPRLITSLSISKLLPLALLAVVAACDSAVTPTEPSAPQYARTKSIVQTSIVITAPSVSAGQDALIHVMVFADGSPIAGKNVILNIDGAFADAHPSSKDGTTTFTVPGLSAGTHSLRVVFDGDANYFGSERTGSITIN